MTVDGEKSVREILLDTSDQLDAFREEIAAGHAEAVASLRALQSDVRAAQDADAPEADD